MGFDVNISKSCHNIPPPPLVVVVVVVVVKISTYIHTASEVTQYSD